MSFVCEILYVKTQRKIVYLTAASEFSLEFSSSEQKAELSQVLSDWAAGFFYFSPHFFSFDYPPLFFVSSLDCSEKD